MRDTAVVRKKPAKGFGRRLTAFCWTRAFRVPLCRACQRIGCRQRSLCNLYTAALPSISKPCIRRAKCPLSTHRTRKTVERSLQSFHSSAFGCRLEFSLNNQRNISLPQVRRGTGRKRYAQFGHLHVDRRCRLLCRDVDLRRAVFAGLRETTTMFDLVLGGVVAVIILVYLLYALMRPEQL